MNLCLKIFQIRKAQPQKACLGKVFEETTEDAIAVDDRGRGKEVDVRAELDEGNFFGSFGVLSCVSEDS